MKSKALRPIVGKYCDGTPMRMGTAVHMANPGDRVYTSHSFLFSFGEMGSTLVLAYGDNICEALEHAAEVLVDNEWWGHITPHGEDLCCGCSDPLECDSHTYTESGWLTSYEWDVTEDPSKQDLIKLHFDGHRRT